MMADLAHVRPGVSCTRKCASPAELSARDRVIEVLNPYTGAWSARCPRPRIEDVRGAFAIARSYQVEAHPL